MVNPSVQLDRDVVIVGGGVAGLWTANVLRASGMRVLLVERSALGDGQSTQAQGIVHGGGKYALRSVGDVAAIAAIREMPDRWREHRDGRREPSLEESVCLSDGCWLWLPRGNWRSRWEAATLMRFLRHGGVLSCPPVRMERGQWPAVLQECAFAAYRMREPVLETRSVLAALARPLAEDSVRAEVLGVQKTGAAGDEWTLRLQFEEGSEPAQVRAGAVVLAAGAGNEALARLFSPTGTHMQRRPLRMALLRGDLPHLHGHCISGGRTRMTITSVRTDVGDVVWQIGGEVAERNAGREDEPRFHREVVAELGQALPGLELSGLHISGYVAVRAEGAHAEHKRPSGVQVDRVAPGVLAVWPTKWAMAPLLAEEVRVALDRPRLTGDRSAASVPSNWPRPRVAAHPWEKVQWTPVDSVARS